MPDLNEMVLPSVWSLTRSLLLESGPLEFGDIVERLTPYGLIDRERQEGSRHVRPSVRALVDSGVLEEKAGKVALLHGVASESAFRFAVAQAILGLPTGADVWEASERGDRPEHHAQLAVAWLQLQGIRSEVAGWGETEGLLRHQLGQDRSILRDTAPFNTLERWAVWLGVGAHVPTGRRQTMLMPDPTAMIYSGLPDLLPDRAPLSLATFVDRAGEAFAWLPEGRIGTTLAEMMRDVPDGSVASGRVSQSLSLALLRLRNRGLIELEAGDDTIQRTSLSLAAGELRPIARVTRL